MLMPCAFLRASLPCFEARHPGVLLKKRGLLSACCCLLASPVLSGTCWQPSAVISPSATTGCCYVSWNCTQSLGVLRG